MVPALCLNRETCHIPFPHQKDQSILNPSVIVGFGITKGLTQNEAKFLPKSLPPLKLGELGGPPLPVFTSEQPAELCPQLAADFPHKVPNHSTFSHRTVPEA